MGVPDLIIPAASDTPALHLHANPLYALYHYLVREGQRPEAERHPALREAARKAARARHLRGPNGIWEVWEQPLAAAEQVDDAIDGLTAAMNQTAESLGSALREAEHIFREEIWPERRPMIDAALATIEVNLVPRFAAIARQQAADLDLLWPERIDAYLVADCYSWQGGYSHPLTIDVSAYTGLTLCETLLHEATHVADVHTSQAGKQSLSTRLTHALTAGGMSPSDTWNIWHAIIFAASARQVRRFIDQDYVDFAEGRGLYAWFGIPKLPHLWLERINGKIDEQEFLRAVSREDDNHGA